MDWNPANFDPTSRMVIDNWGNGAKLIRKHESQKNQEYFHHK